MMFVILNSQVSTEPPSRGSTEIAAALAQKQEKMLAHSQLACFCRLEQAVDGQMQIVDLCTKPIAS